VDLQLGREVYLFDEEGFDPVSLETLAQ